MILLYLKPDMVNIVIFFNLKQIYIEIYYCLNYFYCKTYKAIYVTQ